MTTRETMAPVVKAYKAAKRALDKAERTNAGAEDLRPVVKAKGALAMAEEAMVLRMVAECSKADPSKRDALYDTFSRARPSVIYWPKMVATALRYAGAVA